MKFFWTNFRGGCLEAVGALLAAALVGCDESSVDDTKEDHQGENTDAILDLSSEAGLLPIDLYPWLVHVGFPGCGGALVASNVVLTARHCTSDIVFPPMTLSNDDLRAEIWDLVGSTPVRVVPYPGLPVVSESNPDHQGSDVVLLVFPDDVAIPRRLLTPAKVASSGSAVPDSPMLISPTQHGVVDGDCVVQADLPHFLHFYGASSTTDDDDLPSLDFFSFRSEVCKGDSGSPVVDAGSIVSLAAVGVAGGGTWMSGPWLSNNSQGVRSWLHENALDRDDDGIEAWADNCDTVANPAQVDSDEDGTGNACDPCPHEAFESLDWADLDPDEDGFPSCLGPMSDPCPFDGMGDPQGACANTERGQAGDSDCDLICDSVDACPSTPNFELRENSNLEAETRWGAALVPDACEPVLVPKGAIDPKGSTSTLLSSFNTTFYDAMTWIQVDDKVTQQYLPSRNISGGSPEHVDVSGVATSARFCQPSQTVVCLALANIDADRLWDAPTAATETSSQAWHRISLGGTVRGASPGRVYDNTSLSLTWKYASDESFWMANGIVDVPPPETHPMASGVTTSGLDGYMWFHADSTVGHPGASASNVGTGVHPGPSAIADTSQLASSYFAIDPESIRHSQKHHPLELDIPRFAWRDLPRWPDDYRALFWGIDPLDHLEVFETTDHQFGYLTADGMIQPLTEIMSPALQARLGENHVWVKSEESWAHFAAPDSPTAVVLSTDGTEIVDRIVLGADGISFDVAGPAGASPVFPAGVSGFAAVYARSLGAVFRVGGTYNLPMASVPAGVWRFDASTGEAFQLEVPFQLGVVKAASFDAVTRELVVLHEITVPGKTSILLSRIDALGRGGRTLMSWARNGPCTDLWLTVDGRGRTILSANRPATGTYEMYSLAGEGSRFVSRRLRSAAGTLATQPWSNEKRFYAPVRPSPASAAVSVHWLGLATTGTVTDVATCL